jgi:hypothetical protein
VVCENRALWLAAKFPTSQFRCSEATERCGWPENLLNFVKFRNEALWLVENYPTSQISQHHAMEHSGWLKIIQPLQLNKDFATQRCGWSGKIQPPPFHKRRN